MTQHVHTSSSRMASTEALLAASLATLTLLLLVVWTMSWTVNGPGGHDDVPRLPSPVAQLAPTPDR